MSHRPIDEQVEELLKSITETGIKQLKCCNTPNHKALNELVNDINTAFTKAARASTSTGSTVL